jgi:molecular chaperone GrpE (heat shock protein)
MTYQEIESLAKSLSYRDKLHLAQSMLQMARKEEEEQNSFTAKCAAEFPNIVERVKKSKPAKKKSVSSFIKDMFIFRGGITDDDIEGVVS